MLNTTKQKFIAVIGGSQATPAELAAAEQVGRELARAGVALVCGGMGGVMEAACKGARLEDGLTIGILPGESRLHANEYVTIPIVTGIGHARNLTVIKSAHAVIAIGGSYGTLSEIGHALQSGLPIIGLGTWTIYRKGTEKIPIIEVKTPAEAVKTALEMTR
ncbi:MAG: TIGR00725 family protein [Dehalococcoidia bacterium]|nr:TIGR00725 family protein [Dehalococcoidia bacterium]